MSFIVTVAEDRATGAVAAMYDRVRGTGALPNWAYLFSPKPELLDGWQALLGAVKAGQDLRRYELATLGAARALGSSYSCLAHGQVLLDDGLAAETLREIAETGTSAALAPAERAILAFAAKVAGDAGAITADDVQALRAEGLTERDILDVAATAAARCVFSKLLDALGARPDAAFRALPDPLRTALTPGRPIAD